MSGEQLERSILERKASDELRAIATAMSLEPVSRVKKADLVTQILRAAGVEVDARATNGNGQGHTDLADGTGARAANGAVTDAREPGEPRAVGDPPVNGDQASEVLSPTGSAPKPRATRARSAKKTAETKKSAVAETNGTTVPGTGDSDSAGEVPGALALSDETAGDPSEGPAKSTVADDKAPGDSGAPSGTGADTGTGPSRAGSNDSRGSVTAQNRPQRERQQYQGNQSQNGQANQYSQGNQNQGGPGNQQTDAGNRRGRRRRGRDREREPQGQGGGQVDAPYQGELVPVKGLLDLRDEGYGFLRTSGYLPSQKDVYVSVSQARRFGLRRGDAIEGGCRPAGPSEKYPALLRIDTICGMAADEAARRPRFEDLTPLFPDERLRLEMPDDPANVTARIVDLISPIGKGQRGMIVSPSKAGKTTVLKQIAHSVELNNPDVHLMVLLVDERPEEVTDMRRSVRGEVMASTFDRPADEHTALAELAMERAKRLVELGRDVVIILDGITRLARAYNLAQPATGRIMSGGVDSGALYPPKKFFGAARNIEEGGSLTILATALIETGSKMDEVIFEEFKGTGNMELRLDRKLAERRIYPAIDVNASSTRHEELLFDRGQLQQVWKLRRVLNALGAEGNSGAGLELLMDKIKTTRSNDEFLLEIAKAPSPSN
ncbi:MAG: transcription termination factor Rho [Acidimicrobiales bacterium]